MTLEHFPATILTKKMLRPLRGEEGELLSQHLVGAVKKQRARPPTLPSTEAPTPLVSHTFNAEHWGSSGTHGQLINSSIFGLMQSTDTLSRQFQGRDKRSNNNGFPQNTQREKNSRLADLCVQRSQRATGDRRCVETGSQNKDFDQERLLDQRTLI